MSKDFVVDDLTGLPRAYSEYSNCGRYDYRTEDGEYEFNFELVDSVDEVRIYIVNQPEYGDRKSDGHSTHRFYDENRGQHWICVAKKHRPTNVPDALSWLVYWSEQTGKYISTGKKFS